MRILYASSEVAPFAKTGGLADVAKSLPRALGHIGCELSVVMPYYRCVKEMGLNVQPFRLGEFEFLRRKDTEGDYIFVVNDEYYMRDNLYSEPSGDYSDNDLRFSHFSRAITHLATRGELKPDVIHLNDWQTGLVPVYLRLQSAAIKTLFTIHNIGYQGLFSKDSLEKVGVPRSFFKINGLEYYGKISFLKAGIVYSSAVSTVSEGYKKEILTKKFGCGMEGILKTRKKDLYGIVNGVDYNDWDPGVDRFIRSKYGPDSIENKLDCKKDLIKSVGLPALTEKRPLIGVISRLAEQKGIDLIVEAAKDIIELGASVVILGTGDEKYNILCKDMALRYPGYVSSSITFDNALAHKIEAGCDMFMMPSRYEPCGLNQLYSMRYGTVPIVRATGGLDDTIIDLEKDPARGNGIKFSEATCKGLVTATARAISLYKDKNRWQKIVKSIMRQDFSWETSAGHYKELYGKL